MDRIDCLVVGAGVIGLACARALARAGLEVVIVERELRYGAGVSSRNSEVIHAGLYDAPGSLKATLCVRGNRLLYDYCGQRHIPHRRCGKLLVATRAQELPLLEQLAARAAANGAVPLQRLNAAQAAAVAPELACAAALWSPSSGIVDSHALMTALLADAEAAGAVLAVGTEVTSAAQDGNGWGVAVRSGSHPPRGEDEVGSRWLVNAAGLDAQSVAAACGTADAVAIPPLRLAKGSYFACHGRAPFNCLLYPMPVDGGLGIHLTLDLAGQARFGPDVEWLQSSQASQAPQATADIDYAVDPARAEVFAAEVRRYWPRLPDGALQPAYSGVRPKLSGPGEPAADFRIDGPAQHGRAGLVHLFGIESPGLTASLAIAERVAALVAGAAGIDADG